MEIIQPVVDAITLGAAALALVLGAAIFTVALTKVTMSLFDGWS